MTCFKEETKQSRDDTDGIRRQKRENDQDKHIQEFQEKKTKDIRNEQMDNLIREQKL